MPLLPVINFMCQKWMRDYCILVHACHSERVDHYRSTVMQQHLNEKMCFLQSVCALCYKICSEIFLWSV